MGVEKQRTDLNSHERYDPNDSKSVSRIHFLKDLESHACSRKIITVPWVREQAGKHRDEKDNYILRDLWPVHQFHHQRTGQ